MDKPQSVVYEELRSGIAQLINDSGLPAFMVEPIMRDFVMELRDIARNQYETEKSQYESYLASQDTPAEVDAEIIEDVQ